MSKVNYPDKIPSDEDCLKILSAQKDLSKQSFKTLENPKEISPFNPEIMSRQATLNVGTIGHVAHGKTTLVRAITGVDTIRHKNEKERNITYYLGYANAKIFKCPKCPKPQCFKAYGSAKEDNPICENCNSQLELFRHVSFVDCPGHDLLMSTMLNGAAVMDAALLLIAANEPCPQPQTSEHFSAIQTLGLKNIIIIQNKIDIVNKEDAIKQNYKEIQKFLLEGSIIKNAPIIPISAQLKYNVDVVIEYLCKIPIPKRDFVSPPRFIIVRSFDVNRPGQESKALKGGVAGGTLMKGVLRLGEVVEIKPGLVTTNSDGDIKIEPMYSRIESLFAEKNNLIYAIPGGLIGVGLTVDPFLTKKDALVGKILGHPGKLPDIYNKIVVKIHLLKKLIGLRNQGGGQLLDNIAKIRKNEALNMNLGGTTMGVKAVKIEGEHDDEITFEIVGVVCCEVGEKIALSRKIRGKLRLIGWGLILEGGNTVSYNK